MLARALLAVGFAAAAFSGAFAQAVPAAVASCDLDSPENSPFNRILG
jgi:hypothetical protein